VISVEFDETDYKVLRALQADARMSFREIARTINVSEGTVYNRVKAMEAANVIRGSTIDISYSQLGYIMTAIIGMRIQGGHLPEIEGRISEDPNVLAVYDVTGEYDAVVIVKVRTREELNAFVKRINALPHVDRTYTMLALDVLKEAPGIMVMPPATAPPRREK
jgi:DNA-binding Lrp family transcriptional regulator